MSVSGLYYRLQESIQIEIYGVIPFDFQVCYQWYKCFMQFSRLLAMRFFFYDMSVFAEVGEGKEPTPLVAYV